MRNLTHVNGAIVRLPNFASECISTVAYQWGQITQKRVMEIVGHLYAS